MSASPQAGPRVSAPLLAVADLNAWYGHSHILQGVALEVEPFPYTPLGDLLAQPGNLLVLDHLQDPQNFGALVRAAEAAGVLTLEPYDEVEVRVPDDLVGTEKGDDFIATNTPQQRAGQVHELDGPVLLLASDAGSFMTGAIVMVDGGWTAKLA